MPVASQDWTTLLTETVMSGKKIRKQYFYRKRQVLDTKLSIRFCIFFSIQYQTKHVTFESARKVSFRWNAFWELYTGLSMPAAVHGKPYKSLTSVLINTAEFQSKRWGWRQSRPVTWCLCQRKLWQSSSFLSAALLLEDKWFITHYKNVYAGVFFIVHFWNINSGKFVKQKEQCKTTFE